MKAVLISIQPKWCELIASGIKTVEVRKSKPKIETPFKVYIYETQGRKYSFKVKADTIAKHDDDRFLDCARGNPPIKEDKNGKPYFSYGRMKVIGEFVCDEITEYPYETFNDGEHFMPYGELEKTCLDGWELYDYLGTKDGYGWHISNLKIYDKPKELSEFYRVCEKPECDDCPYLHFENTPNSYEGWCMVDEKIPLKRPPQSWCYVEELKEGATND